MREVKKAVARPTPKPSPPSSSLPPGLAALPRTPGRPENANLAAKNTNPLFGLTGGPRSPVYYEQGKAGQPWTSELGPLPYGAYEQNCTNVVLAWDMRMRGFDTQAAPLEVLDRHGYADGRTFDQMDQLLADAYRLPNGKPHGRSFFGTKPTKPGKPKEFLQPWRSLDDIDAEIERDWPEGGRGVITTGKHVFNVTKVGGKARYIEAQSDEVPSRTVTRKYKARYRSEADSSGTAQEGKLIRLDDLVPTDAILPTVTTKAQAREHVDQQSEAQAALPRPRSEPVI